MIMHSHSIVVGKYPKKNQVSSKLVISDSEVLKLTFHSQTRSLITVPITMNALENLTSRSSCIIGSSMLSSLAYRPGRLLGDSGQLGSCLCTFDPVAEGEFLPPRSSLSFQSQPAQEVHQNHRGLAMCFLPWRFLSAVLPLGAVFAFSQVDAKETAPLSMANVTMCLNRAFFWQR